MDTDIHSVFEYCFLRETYTLIYIQTYENNLLVIKLNVNKIIIGSLVKHICC